MFDLLKAAGAGVGGAYGAISGNAEEEAKKKALAQLGQNFERGSFGAPVQPIEKGPNPLSAAVGGVGQSLMGDATAEDKDEKDPWYKSAARGFLGK